MIDSEALVTISAAVVALTQLLKVLRLPKTWGVPMVFGVSALGVLLYAYSQVPEPWNRHFVWSAFSAWVVVTTSASGAYGLVKDTAGLPALARLLPKQAAPRAAAAAPKKGKKAT